MEIDDQKTASSSPPSSKSNGTGNSSAKTGSSSSNYSDDTIKYPSTLQHKQQQAELQQQQLNLLKNSELSEILWSSNLIHRNPAMRNTKENMNNVTNGSFDDKKDKKNVKLDVDGKIGDPVEFENLLDPQDILYVPNNCAEQVEQFAKYVWETGWKAMPHHALPNWLRDNDFLLKGHRPPLPSVRACFKSIFRIHTETGNIWTHFIGAISFVAIAIYFWSRPNPEIKFQEKIIFGTFFIGAIICLLCSALFHTFYCYSPNVSKLFSKIDYCGISVLTMGSFVPWLYYAFYCDALPKIAYLVLIGILGISCIVVSLWDKFSTPQFRAVRAGMFIALGLSGLIPALHYILVFGSYKAFNVGALGWLILMAILYITGACLYAARIPERLFPGKFDIWFQSHQIFHVFVVMAAYVHFHGITKLASYRLTIGDCLTAHTEADFSFEF
ncbi:adiponectin receptor [Brachionus plicatilis]|uniref:Adiponectin receptor n=1 Tax=Brachionus plicatilis TaxID=10195 RepID=A0A3M7RFP7_BRAPC|nr:adiponectin receptor [Brachionus plicatilis]